MILAAGEGRRMRPLTEHTPKPLLVAGGKPLIGWQIERLRAAGFQHLVINHAHLGMQIETQLQDGADYGVHIAWSREPEPLETAGGIATAMSLLGDAPFLVTNGDVYVEFDYARLRPLLAEMASNPHHLAHLVLVDNPSHHRQGDFALQDGMVLLPSPAGGRGAGGEGRAEADEASYTPRLPDKTPDQIRHFARELRAQQSDAEQLVWHALRGRNLLGYKFRRQHPVDNYILDFYCADLKLAVELDVGQHAEQLGYDQRRTEALKTHGIRVLRYWNNDVLQKTEEVLEDICRHLPMDAPSPPAPLPPAGEGSKLLIPHSSLLTFSGIGLYRPELFAGITPGSKAPLAPLLKAAMAEGRVTGEHFTGRWEDVGTPERLAGLDRELHERLAA